MPIHKTRLSRAEEAAHLNRLQQLQAEGLDVEIPEQWQLDSRGLEIVLAGLGEGTVFESPTGGVCYAVLARLLALRSGLIVEGWGLATAYDDQIVPESFDGRDLIFRLGGQEYRPCEVLNSRIEKGLVLSRGQIAEGWLLATGIAPIPAQYSDFAAVPFQLRVWDQFGREYSAKDTLSALRRTKRGDTAVPKGTGLYGLDATGKPAQLSLEEDMRRRYIESIRQRMKTEGNTGANAE